MLKNLKIGKRLIVAFIIVAVIVGISGIMGVVLLSKSDTDYSHALENYGFASGKIGMLNAEINNTSSYIRDIVFLTEQAQLDEASAKLQECFLKIDSMLKEVATTNSSDAAKTLFGTIEKEIQDYRVIRDQVINFGMINERDSAYELWTTSAGPKIEKVSKDLGTLYDMNFEAGQSVSTNLTDTSKITIIIMISVVIAGFVIALILSIFIANGISKPITEIEIAAKNMSKGNYDSNIGYHSRDEIGSLSDSMRTMSEVTNSIILDTSRGLSEIASGNFNITPQVEYIGVFSGIEKAMIKIITDLSDTMLQIRMSSDQVSSGSEQVASGAQSLAQGATEQASSVQELSASINEVSQQINDNASNAATASDLVNGVGDVINTSNNQMTEMMSAISDISMSSSQISKIIKTIEDIAFQTNILALNAAVEAARAGAAGKGFAVVADEVRNLATKSSEAAKQTNALIEGSVKSVENGVKIANETAKSLSEVVTGAKDVTKLIIKISEASAEQSTSISQINLGVEQISSVVQTNSATSEESAAASEELNGQASVLKELVGRFKLKDSDAEPAMPTRTASYPAEIRTPLYSSGESKY